MKINSVFGILSLVIPVLTDKRSIMRNSKVESWISTENFTTMVRKSFLYSKCCNIFLSESIHDVEMLFHQFIDIYPHEYLLHKIVYDCQGYFLLGPTDEEIRKAMQLVPSLISTTEILIIIDGELQNTSTIFDVSLYGNSNANIIAKSGIWTLSENYLEPRFFLKVNSYDELMSEFEMVNLRGRELQACTFYQPPFSYLKSTTKKIIKGVEEEVFLADNDDETDGVEVKMFLAIAEKLNFTWTIRNLPGNYRYGRRINNTHWEGGVIQLIREKKVDIAFGSIWLTQNHNEFVNMTTPWIQMLVHFLVPRPQPITSFWALTRPFSVGCWILVIVMLFVKSIYMYTRAKIDPKFPKRFRSFFCTITELLGRLVGTWMPRNTANARFELHLWQTTGFLLVTAYCSSLAARLTSSEYEDKIDTVRQFLEANLSWGHTRQKPYWPDYFDMDDPYTSQLPSRHIPVLPENQAIIYQLVKKSKFAIFGKLVDSIFFPEDEEVFYEYIQDYRLMREKVGNYYSSFAVQPWLLRPVDTVTLWLKESGIARFYLKEVLHRRASSNLRGVLKEYNGIDGNFIVLGLTPLGAGFIALIAGLLLSVMVFLYEIKQAADSRPIREVFRDIQERREKYKSSSYKIKRREEIEPMDRH